MLIITQITYSILILLFINLLYLHIGNIFTLNYKIDEHFKEILKYS